MKRAGLPVVLVAVSLGTGCLVHIDHVSDPRPAFRQAREEARRYQGRSGPAREVNVLAYDAGDQEMVRVSIPLALARKLCEDVDWEADLDIHDDDADRVAGRVRRHVRSKDLDRARPGILVEVEEDGGDLVLVWLR